MGSKVLRCGGLTGIAAVRRGGRLLDVDALQVTPRLASTDGQARLLISATRSLTPGPFEEERNKGS